jgi:PiT family inorganic phosphate transporter
MGILERVVIPMIAAPLVGFGLGYVFMVVILWTFRRAHVSRTTRNFRYAQIASSATMALGHGMQDAQKTMGIITLALFTAGEIDSFEVPLWVVLAAAAAISAGTYAGGFRIMRTLGRRIIQLTPAGGFAAQTVASSLMVTTATVFAAPVSTTHITSTSVMGVGSTRRLSAVRWGVAGNIVVAWVVTLPAAGSVAAVAYFLTHAALG